MGLFDSLKDLAEDIFDIATAPIKVAVDTTRVVTKPIADAANEITDEVKDALDDITES